MIDTAVRSVTSRDTAAGNRAQFLSLLLPLLLALLELVVGAAVMALRAASAVVVLLLTMISCFVTLAVLTGNVACPFSCSSCLPELR